MRSCFFNAEPFSPHEFVGTLTHPSGAVGQFTVAIQLHGRSNVPISCSGFSWPHNNMNDDINAWPISYHGFSLKRKRVTGPALTPAEWNYSYIPNISYFFHPGSSAAFPVCPVGVDCSIPSCTSDSCAGASQTVVTGPDNTWLRYHHGNSYRYNEGKLLKVESGTSASNILSTVTHSYDLSQAAQAYPARYGTSPREADDAFVNEYHRPLLRTETQQQSVTFSRQINAFDAYARPTRVTRASTPGQSRTTLYTYHDNTARWVLGQTATVQDQASGLLEAEVSYHPTSVLPTAIIRFHQPDQTYTYHADGNLHTVTDGRNHRFTLGNYHRGVPRTIQWPTGVSQTAVVDVWGRITSVTDVLGNTTGYSYDAMGRLSGITYPSGDSTQWTPTTLAFTQVNATEYGIPAGHWRRTVSTGNQREITYYDAMWRPVLTHEFDAASQAATSRFTARRFDHEGRETFTAYPVASVASWTSPTLGVRTTYDALGRPIRAEQDSELGVLVSTTRYLGNAQGHYTEVTNPRNHVTRTWFQSFDQPSMDASVRIAQPEGVTTVIQRDVFGKPLSITRSGTWAGATQSLTRHYVYGINQRLCKRIEPESGVTLMAYDGAGNVAWSAEGSTLDSTTSCDRFMVPESERTYYTYDAMNRLTLTQYPAGTQSVSRSYFADGALRTVTRGNVTLTYGYNKRRLPTTEQLSANGILWNSSYAYTGLGHVASLTYPDGLVVDYQPNALGQPTRAGSFATGVGYFPNGALRQFTYGNGIVHTVTQNARQLPDRARDAHGSTVFVDMQTSYDGNGNLLGIFDHAQAGRQDRGMTYDGLDRLRTVYAPNLWGNASYVYDPLDNLRSADVGSRQYRYHYDAANRLSAIRTPAGATVFNLSHDVRGNQTAKGSRTYTWDRANRLLSIPGVASYVYDGLGRRTQHTGNGAAVNSYYSQAGQLLFEADQGRAEQRSHIYLGSRLVATRQRANSTGALTVRYLHTDALGSPVAETGANRAVLSRTEYEPYGAALNRVVDGPGYTGHVMDGHSGLTYMQQRYYDPQIGVFLGTDPVTPYAKPINQFNRYRYAYNNPYKLTDPDGRDPLEFFAGYIVGFGNELAGGMLHESYGEPDSAAAAGFSAGQTGGAVFDALNPRGWVKSGARHAAREGSTQAASRYRRSDYGYRSDSPAARAAREAGEGQPCPNCGQTMRSGTRTAPQAQHEPPISVTHYEEGGAAMSAAQRRAHVNSDSAINGANCAQCQSREGARQRAYVREQERLRGGGE